MSGCDRRMWHGSELGRAGGRDEEGSCCCFVICGSVGSVLGSADLWIVDRWFVDVGIVLCISSQRVVSISTRNESVPYDQKRCPIHGPGEALTVQFTIPSWSLGCRDSSRVLRLSISLPWFWGLHRTPHTLPRSAPRCSARASGSATTPHCPPAPHLFHLSLAWIAVNRF